MKFISNAKIEEMTLNRISEYEKKHDRVKPPIPLDQIIEQIFNLIISWDSLGKEALGGLNPQKRLLTINEDYLYLFKEKPGLERFTKAHELGHWDLHVDEAKLSHASLFNGKNSECFFRKTTPKGNLVYIIKNSWSNPEIYKALKTESKHRDSSIVASQVGKYASYLLMPTHLVKEYIKKVNSDIYSWPSLFRMAEAFDVTITALKIRLMQLGLIYVSEDFNDKNIYHSKEEYFGQGKLI